MNRDQRRDAIEQLSSSLIKRESENPPGNEQDCAAFIVDWFTEHSVDATLVPDPYDGRSQAVARIGTGDPTIVLNGHIDVVPAGDRDQWTYDPYDPTVEDGRLYGRGSTDMKTPLACGMLVAAELAEEIESGELNGSIVVHAAVGEETGDPGTKRLLDLGYDGEFGVVLEPTGLRTATSQKGLAWYEITLAGEAGHASRPHNATNPLDYLGAVLDKIEDYDHSIRSRTDELVGCSTATVTSIDTGTKENVIPGEVVVTIDRRILPSETADRVDEEIQSILEGIDTGEDVSLTWRRIKTFESAEIPSDSTIAEVFRKHTYEVDGISRSPWGDDASSDVRNFINDANMEAITWGPSDTDLAHRTDEYIQLNRAVVAHEILKKALRELLEASNEKSY